MQDTTSTTSLTSLAQNTEPAGPERYRWRRAVPLLVILIAAGALRMYRVDAPADDFLSFRHTDTLMVARNFYRNDMKLFRPEVDWRQADAASTDGTLGGGELMLVPYLTAGLYHVFGLHDWVGRVWPILFSLAGLVFFYLLAQSLFGLRTAILATILLAVSPYYLYCGRAQAPEPLAHALVISSLYFCQRWVERGGLRPCALSIVSSTLTLLAKPQMGIVAIPMAYLVVARHGWKRLLAPAVIAHAVTVGFITGGFLYWSFRVLPQSSGIMLVGDGWYFEFQKWLTDPGYYAQIAKSLWLWSVTPFVCIWALAGIIAARIKKTSQLGAVWLCGSLLLFFIVPGGAQTNGYYQMIVEPPACLLAGIGLAAALSRRWIRWLAVVSIPFAVLYSLSIAMRLYEPNYQHQVACGEWLRANTPADAKVATASPSPTVLYYADRIGWRSWPKSWGPSPAFDRNFVERIRELGSDYVAIPFPDYDDAHVGDFTGVRDYLYENFRCYKTPAFTVYALNEPAALDLPENGRIVFGRPESRIYLRGNWGLDQTLASGVSFTEMGPGQSASVRFAAEAAPRRITLMAAALVPQQVVRVSINGSAPIRFDMPFPGAEAPINLLNVPPPDASGRYTIEIVADRLNAQGSGLALFELLVRN